jgi:hypothetical protein
MSKTAGAPGDCSDVDGGPGPGGISC